jgi:hypothetical protein
MRQSRRARLRAYLDGSGWAAVGEDEFRQLVAALAPVREQDLRRLLRDCGLALSPMVEGVRQSSLEGLERTLGALAEEYGRADADRRRAVRRLVITARDHARLTGSGAKAEAILWMNVWLENPMAFRLWVDLRKAAHGAGLL